MRCFALPETRHDLAVILQARNAENLRPEQRAAVLHGAENLIRCAFRENAAWQVATTCPWSRFSFSRLGQELHDTFPLIEPVRFSQDDILSGLDIPRLNRAPEPKWIML